MKASPDMAGETVITIIGNLTDDPELRFTPSGAAVAGFTVASGTRVYDKESGQWKDGDTLFLRCSVWRKYAENVAESLSKGMNVIVQGRLKQRSYTDREGVKRTSVELDIDEIGPTLKWATAKVAKANAERSAGAGEPDWSRGAQSPADDSPWSVPVGAGTSAGAPF